MISPAISPVERQAEPRPAHPNVSVLLIGKDWKARALLRAQLLEDGIEVQACETTADAGARMAGPSYDPQLIVADLFASDDASAELELLAQCAKHTPTWVLAARHSICPAELARYGFERVFFRPVHLGKLVEQIKERLEPRR